MLGSVARQLGARTPAVQSCRFLRARWERGYLKDLYHRRQLLGADPIISRSSYPNWNYSSEVFAFGHRIGAVGVDATSLVQALTTDTYHSRADVQNYADGASPSNDSSFNGDSNAALVTRGTILLDKYLKSFLRSHLHQSPEELIEAVVDQLSCDDVLSDVAKHIGVESIIRTGEHPASSASVSSAFRALLAVVGPERAQQLVVDLVMPQLLDVDFAEVFPLVHPLSVLTDLAKMDGAKEIEPRLLRSAGEVSAQSVFIVGIYKDKEEIIGQSAGETVEVAIDMAAREGLLRLWGLTSNKVFFFGDRATSTNWAQFTKENYRLRDKCSNGVDLSLESSTEDPINIVEVAMRYRNEIDDVVGKSYTKRLRHKFSRGSLAKRSFRYLIKPKVYTVA